MQTALHSGWFHTVIVILVVADALIVIFELLLDVGAFGAYSYLQLANAETHTTVGDLSCYTSHFEICSSNSLQETLSARERLCLTRKRVATIWTQTNVHLQPS